LKDNSPFRFDEIGAWSEIKLEIIEKYLSAYTTAFTNRSLKKYYIDAFCGPGVHLSKTDKNQIEGSPARSLKAQPPFDGYYFIDSSEDKIDFLRKAVGTRSDVFFHAGDSNAYLSETLLPSIQYKKYNRALCFLDPYGLDLNWEVIYLAGQSRAIDMFLNFPVMDMNRNALWRNIVGVPQEGVERMTRFWGDASWKEVAYAPSPQFNMFGPPDSVKQSNQAIVSAFSERLKTVAGFEYVAEPLPMKNSQNSTVYYLFFASPKPIAKEIISDILRKYR
jgi:three-Cys-motif partner protein